MFSLSRTTAPFMAALALVLLLPAAAGVAGPPGKEKTPPGKDREPPTVPADLRVAAATGTSAALEWAPSSDNDTVAGYVLYPMNGDTKTTTYSLSDLACGTGYTVGVDAYDRRGNRSEKAWISFTTPSCGPPEPASPPTISGTAQEGATLTAAEGSWTNSPTTYAYAWTRCDSAGANCSAVSGATAKTYLVASADVNRTLRVRVTASNAAGSTSATSALTAVVTALAPKSSVSYPASYFTGPLGAKNVLPSKVGAFVGVFPQGSWSEKQNEVVRYEQYLGRTLDMVHLHYGAPSDGCYYTAPFSQGQEKWVTDRGSIPVISWTHGWTLDSVNTGRADACLRDVAARFAAWGQPILLRTYWEFNGSWFRWSGTGEKFITAWKRTVDVMRSAGATNVGFVWCPDEGNFPGTVESYPGDGYVDWVCSDKYNWNSSTASCRGANGTWHSGWCEFEETFRDGSSIEALFGPRKPFMVGETGSVEDSNTAGRKGQWHRNARDAIKARFPYLKAYLYFDVDMSAAGHRNWRLDTTQTSLEGFRDLTRDAHFNTRAG